MKLTPLIFTIAFSIQNANAQWSVKHLNETSNISGTVKFKNDSLGLFMGGGISLKTTDAGETWNTRQLDIDIYVNNFQFLGDSSVLAVGSGKLILSENLGESWNSVSILEGKQLHSLWFFDNDSGVVAGNDGIYRTVNAGISWDTVWSITQSGYQYGELTQLSFPSAETGYAIGIGRNRHNNPNFDHFLLKSNDSGVTWDSIKTFPKSSLNSICFINQDTGFIGANSGLLYKTFDGGISWIEIQITNSWNPVKSIQFISETKGFATGGVNLFLTSGGSSNFFISETIDRGNTWTTYDTLGVALNSIFFINDTVGFVSGDYELIMKTNGKLNELPENYPWYLVESMDADEDKLSDSEIKIYPNPAVNELKIENHTGKKLSLKIIDITGRTIIEQPLNDVKSTINLNASPGVYSVLIRDERGERMLERKIVKQ